MPVKPAGREELHAFFQFDDIIERPRFAVLLFLLQLAAMGYGFAWALRWERPDREAIFGLVYMDAALIALVIMAFSACLIFFLLSVYKSITRLQKTHRRLALETNARALLRQDYKRAMRAILKASGLRPDDMLPVKTVSSSGLEQLLFSETELSDFLGEVRHQSFRAITPYGRNVAYAPVGRHHQRPDAYLNGLYTPFYLFCLFITETHYVIGEAVCNSLTGTLQQRVRRIRKDTIASSEFGVSKRTFALPDRILDAWLENRRLDEKEIRSVSANLKKQEHANRKHGLYRYVKPASPFVQTQLVRFLEITLNDGRSVQLPTGITQAILHRDISDVRHETGRIDDPGIATGWGDITFKARGFDPYSGSFLDEPSTAEKIPGERALWSTGRQSTRRAFTAFPNLFATLLTALVLAAGILWLMNSLTNDTSQSQSSSDESGYRMDTPQGIVPVKPV